MTEYEKPVIRTISRAEAMSKLDRHNQISMDDCSYIIGTDRLTLDLMVINRILNSRKAKGPVSKGKGDQLHNIPVSYILRLAYAVDFKNNYEEKRWHEIARTVGLDEVTCSYSIRLKFLKSDYWGEVNSRAREKGIELSDYPNMNIGICESELRGRR